VLGIVGAAANERKLCGYAPEAALWMIRADGTPPPADPKKPGPDPWTNAILHVCDRDSGGRPKVLLLEVQTGIKKRNFEQVESVAAAIRTAIAGGVVVCVAAGNGDSPADMDDEGHTFPETGSILVGATVYGKNRNPRNPNSNYGPSIVVSAPGDPDSDVTCDSTADDEYRDVFGETSGAAAKVAGTVALMLSMNPRLTHADVRKILVDTGGLLTPDPAEPEKTIGRFLNTGAAVKEAIRLRDQAGPELVDLDVPGVLESIG